MSRTLADLTTLRVGGPVGRLVEASTEEEIVETVVAADEAGEPLLVLGGGSNVLAADAGFAGVVVRDARQEIAVESQDACGGAAFWASAGMPWDNLVLRAVAEGWAGVEALSGIPGSTGATPVQNVGAYGQEVGDVVAMVRTWDRQEKRYRTLAHGELGLGYRTSILKESLRDRTNAWYPTPRYVVLRVMFQMRLATRSTPIRYPELARALDVEVGERVDAAEVRSAVLALRAGKGMVLDADDPDTWSAGSFFTNPVLPEGSALPEGAPQWPAGPGLVKTSAAWLIQRAGFDKGFAVPGGGAASLSTKHALAITNRGGARAADLLALARTVRDGVRDAFAITLEPEPVLIGLAL
ncbi:UDP-N-acetylmuramate dehydrogenase [Pseudactinotalea suaedae]|uniref:UDP-N-acetylmuramate dehydrogenase n=1 Tax=Pseudactinotalea suaedae TaxID=1524924 RepID=UPI0012E1E8DA|nr:UDP-N-acetylmuramate dehydrogenase [Pseudactinotalea suaedae]